MLKLWQRLIFSLRESVKSEAARKAAETARELILRGKEGAEVNYIDLPESQAALNLANAVGKLLENLRGEQNAVIRLGPLLLVKHVNGDGVSQVAAETMSTSLRRILDENPKLLENPGRVLEMLQRSREERDPLLEDHP